MDYDEFDARRRALLRLARPQDLINAAGELMDLHDAGFWFVRYAELMQVVDRQDGPPPALDAVAFAELRQLVAMALQVIRALHRRQARRSVPPREA
jgi:hypothetical protein